MILTNVLLFLVTVSLIFRYLLFPLLLAQLTHFRVSAISLLSVRGLEYRTCADEANVVPTVRVEKIGWVWGGLSGDEVGLAVLKLDGVSLRIRSSNKNAESADVQKRSKVGSSLDHAYQKGSERIAAWKGRVLAWALHLFIHHYPSAARIVSIQISDLRLIFDDLKGLELTVKDIRAATKIQFEGRVDPSELTPHQPTHSASNPTPTEENLRRDPLATPSDSMTPSISPVASPLAQFSAFAFPGQTLDAVSRSSTHRASRIAHARRRASQFQSRMTSTASQIWSRAIARAHGSVSFAMIVQDVAFILPHEVVHTNIDDSSQFSRTSDKDDSHNPGRTPPLRSDQPKSFASVGSLHSLFQSKQRVSSIPIPPTGCARLLTIRGDTRATFGLGFGPKKGLLGEDTLRTKLDLGSLNTSIEALEKVQSLMASFKTSEVVKRLDKVKTSKWSARSMRRIVLRAFESVTVSILHVVVHHHLPSENIPSASVGPTCIDTADIALSESEGFILSLDASRLSCTLAAADSSNNQRARNAFGTNSSPESKVRGIAFSLKWSTVALQCLAPGEQSEEMSQLMVIRTAEIEGMSTWRPKGWSREELLFASDPNLALIVMRGSMESINIAGDIQLFDELKHNWKRVHPPRWDKSPRAESRKVFPLPPRLRFVFDVGHAMAILADRASDSKTTLSLASDGLHLGCYTEFSDIAARRRDKIATKTAFKREELLRQRREEAGPGVDYAAPEAMLKPDLRRIFERIPATLQDDYAISMRAEATAVLEPMALHMTLTSLSEKEHQSHHLASIGRAHGIITGDILGKQTILDDGSEIATLDPSSTSCLIDLGIDSGIKLNLYDMSVINALEAMIRAHQPQGEERPAREGSNVLCHLPSGVSMRLSLGVVSIFIGHQDPNPDCSLKLTRGLWIQTTFLWEYAYFNHRLHTPRDRCVNVGPLRGKLRLPEDITTQALAFENALGPKEGKAALVGFTLTDTFVKPIFNGKRFADAGGTSVSHEPIKKVPEKSGEQYVGWEFRRPQAYPSISQGKFANNVEPLDVSDTDQASRPLLQVKRVAFNWAMLQLSANRDTIHRLTSKVSGVDIVCDLSHLYCVLLVGMTVSRITAVPDHSSASKASRKGIRPEVSLDMAVPSIKIHLAFPLKEHLFIYIDNTSISHSPDFGLRVSPAKILSYVPCPREVGAWDELARIKSLEITSAPRDQPKSFAVSAEAARIRIPVSYQLSKLILNINVTLKAIKLLTKDLRSGKFDTVKKPGAEQPKSVPRLWINIAHFSLEAKDDPIETKLNLIWRAGMAEQEKRNEIEDHWETKVRLVTARQLALAQGIEVDSEHDHLHVRGDSKLTNKFTVSVAEARERLDMYKSQNWVKRIRLAKYEQQRREQAAMKHMEDAGLSNVALPITISHQTLSAPLFRLSLEGFRLGVENLGWNRNEIIDYMGGLSSKFDDGAEFSLMVPLKLSWTMDGGVLTLRDYPLPLIRLPSVTQGGIPTWTVEMPFIIAEELQGDDSIILVPTQIIPRGCGHEEAAEFTVGIAKTIMPVKTYCRPIVEVASEKTTEFTWGNSYQPAIQDMMKVIESLSHPPRDPSPRVGFWDKFKLILHWKVTVNFKHNVHMHLKGTYDPYTVIGLGAGFALSWLGGTRLEIAQPNPQFETIQISAPQLLIAIPDLTALHDSAAMGTALHAPAKDPDLLNPVAEESLIDRRHTKPCARFLNGVRVGFGFKFERTCRPWNCDDCGSTENLFHRQCRNFEFKRHQEVILRSPEALEKEEHRLGHPVDSYEGFRSDYIHFSVSVVAPLNPVQEDSPKDAENQNSLHMSPKAFAHFFSWWRLFDHKMSLPIRQGKLFPNSPPPSKKFGRSLGTIKYRCNLAPVYVSHMYVQAVKEMWTAGKSQTLGVKARFDRFKADAHQRAQEMMVRNERLKRTQQVVHKPFYAADLLLSGIQLKGVRADFVETASHHNYVYPDEPRHKASELPTERRNWYNALDFIDADRKPFDTDPKVDIIDIMDCPQVFLSKRNKARQSTPDDGASSSAGSQAESDDSRSHTELESTKFGHEHSHVCYLGAATGVAETQMEIVKQRIKALEMRADKYKGDSDFDQKANSSRLNTLRKHLQHLANQEHRHIDDETLQAADHRHPVERSLNMAGEVAFENTFHIHCPRVYYNNLSRNMLYKYWFSSRDRKREEYMTSHASLRGVRDGIQQRMARPRTGLNKDDEPSVSNQTHEDAATILLHDLQRILSDKSCGKLFCTPSDHATDSENLDAPSLGLPQDCFIKSKHRFLVLKPQIALRSDVDEDSIILLAAEEVSFKGFQVMDAKAKDRVSADVLGRFYAGIKGVQAFHPTAEALRRERDTAHSQRGLDFIPLEIFLDVKSEATDYDRIVMRTDAALHMDKFNHLRVPRGLEWPRAKDEWGQEIKHLRLHQDLTTIIAPRLQVTATAKHYNALYNVVTDLLIYRDPGHRDRSERIDSFILAFDRKDRDPQRLLLDLDALQRSVRGLLLIQRGYEANLDLLSEAGRNELFKIRNDLLEATEQLFTIFEAISVNKARDDARAALKSANRLDVRLGGIAWVMLRDELTPLLKVDIEGTIYSRISNKDGSNNNAVAFGNMCALNSDSDALYPEVLVRDEMAASKRKTQESFASGCWSILAPVGGITIVRYVAFHLFPVRFRLEEKVGKQVTDYIFNRRKRKEKVKDSKEKNVLGMSQPESDRSTVSLRHAGGHDIPLRRSRSQVSIITAGSGGTTGDQSKPDEKFTMVPIKDATEMRKRASANRTFIKVIIASTSFVMSFKSDEKKHHGVSSWKVPDCVDFKIKTPEMCFYNKVWANEDLFEHVKKDIRNCMWSQTANILGQVFKKTSLFRTKKGLRHLAMSSSEMLPRSKSVSSGVAPSHTTAPKYNVQPPTPLDPTDTDPIPLRRAISRVHDNEPTSPVGRIRSRLVPETTPQVMGLRLANNPNTGSATDMDEIDVHDEDGADVEDERLIGVGKTVKGIIGKIKKHTSKFDLPHTAGPSDELSRRLSGDRSLSRISTPTSPTSFLLG